MSRYCKELCICKSKLTTHTGKEPPKGPAASRATPDFVHPMRASLLETQVPTVTSSSSVPEKRLPSPSPLHGSIVANNTSKRRKMILNIRSPSVQNPGFEKPQLPYLRRTGANTAPVMARGHASAEGTGLANLSRPSLPDLGATHNAQAHDGPVRVKEEPEDEASHPFAARGYSGCGIDILGYFSYECSRDPSFLRALRGVQNQMDYYVSASNPTETFQLARSIPKNKGISAGKKRRRTLNQLQKRLDTLRMARLGLSARPQCLTPPSFAALFSLV
jgi:hypothetical protein